MNTSTPSLKLRVLWVLLLTVGFESKRYFDKLEHHKNQPQHVCKQ